MRHLLLATALAVGATTFAAAPLSARDRDRDRDDTTYRITPNQVIDMADARIAQLKADLRLNPDQDKNWGSFQSALHDMAQRRADRMNKMREQRSSQTDQPNQPAPTNATTPPPVNDPNTRPRDDRDYRARDARDDRDRTPDIAADLRQRADAMTARADDYRKFADAGGPLYSSLDDGQRRRFLAFVQHNLMEDDDSGRGSRGRW